MRYLLNSAVITSPGVYFYKHVSIDEAKAWYVEGSVLSTIGYEETAAVLSEILGTAVKVNKIAIKMEVGDEALVFRIVLPKGHARINAADKGQILKVLGDGFWELGLLKRLA
ncbi:MAG: hypothetical protein KatS3mg087_1149 [Patescibacteria group bacterium]|nr:MAG: hypothetical protein KatS3mg087_1149 [Patescibacteria group bacterium]